MVTKKIPAAPKPKDQLMLNKVRANFIIKGTSFNAFCEANNINRRNAEQAILGTWRGKKGKALRSQIIQASKAKKVPANLFTNN
jgi:hypothetical protein